jgi:hypothetical protein
MPGKVALELDDEFEDEPEVDLLRASAEVGIVLIATPQKIAGCFLRNAQLAVLPVHIYVRGSEGQRNSTLVSN